MRVLTFLHSFEPGGVERVALRLVRHWRQHGCDAPLFVGRPAGALRDELARDLPYDVPHRLPPGVAWFETAWMIARLPGRIRRQKPDVLFCAGSTYTIVAVVMKLMLGAACPPVVVKISNDIARRDLPGWARQLWFAWLRMQARFVDRWVAMEDGSVAEIRHALGDVSISVIPAPAISIAQIIAVDRLPPDHGDRRFVAVGRLVPQKNYPLMLRAFAAGTRMGETLTILGDGPARSNLEKLANTLGIAHRVHFAGHVPDAAARLRHEDILLLSSAYEGVPAVLVEALAIAMPIVTTDSGSGVRSLLGHGQFGRVVAPGDLAAAIAAARPVRNRDPALREQARRFAIETSASRYLDEFRAAVAGNAGQLSPLPA